MSSKPYQIFVCTKQRSSNAPEGCCYARGGVDVYAAFQTAIAQQGIGDRVQVRPSGCLDHCSAGAVAMVFQPTKRTKKFDWPFLPKRLRHKLQAKIQKKLAHDRIFYGQLTPADIPGIVQQHCIQDKVVKQSQLDA